jgi:4-azaleucine resistance transporter AzlC
VLLGYSFVGFAFGMLLQDKGFNFLWALFISLSVYAGSMQFVMLNFFSGGLGLIEAAFMTLAVNFRHIFYGLSFLDDFRDMGARKPYMIFSLTDETYSLLCAAKMPSGIDKRWFMFFIALLNQLYWIIGSVVGAVAGEFLTFNSTGIDFAMTALFVVIFVEQWLTYPSHAPALAGLACALVALIIFGADSFVIPAMILIACVLMAMRSGVEKSFKNAPSSGKEGGGDA